MSEIALLLRSQEPNFLIKPSVDTVPSGVPRILLDFGKSRPTPELPKFDP